MPLLLVPDRQLSLFCPKGKMIFKTKKNLRIGEAELSLFMSEELAGIFRAPMLEEFKLMNAAGLPPSSRSASCTTGRRWSSARRRRRPAFRWLWTTAPSPSIASRSSSV